ncbi:MAG: DUF1028 domain-containing protein [Proteobacteria bacterium]|nr:DUF1028 domain-containing protein [Pseudomonadota bacterium]
MTWSIIARDGDSGSLGIAVASRFFAVGSLVPWIRSGVGAVATQAMLNPLLGPAILDRLEQGETVDAALNAAWGRDDGAAVRQIHAMDGKGNRTAHTGNDCIDWCGDLTGQDVSVAGNMLVGGAVLQACLEEYAAQAALSFPERLLRSLLAGDAAGGDKRGRQSAALRVHTTEVYPDWDLRVDDHPDAPAELARLFTVGQIAFANYKAFIPTRANPAGVTDRDKMAAVRAKADNR